MKKFNLLLLILAMYANLSAQYFTSFSTSTFYDSTSTVNDLHYDEGWTRDTSSITLSNSEIQISIFQNSTYNLTTGFITMVKGDIIYIDHRITNASSTADLTISYLDSANNLVFAKTIAYASANIQSSIDTVNVTQFGSYKINLAFTKNTGNNQQRFIIQDFSVYNPAPLPIRDRDTVLYKNLSEIEDEEIIEVYNLKHQKVFTGLKKDFFISAEKNIIYVVKDLKFIIQ